MFDKKNKTMKHTRVDSIRGFSLIEMMVSLTIFSIVMTISIGTLLIMIDANAKAQALYSSTTNLSFALDSMTREMRTGYHYYCPSTTLSSLPAVASTRNCPSGGDSIAFVRERDGKRMGYKFNSTDKSIEENDGTGSWNRITSEDVVIDTFEITVKNSKTYFAAGDTEQPILDLRVGGYTNNGLDTATDFNIQTRIVQHNLDLF